MRWNGRTRPRNRAMLSCFLPALPLSTCSKVTPIAAINFAAWFTLCRDENDQVPGNFFAQEKAAGGHATRHRFRCRLRRFVGAEHEALAGALDRAFAGSRCGCRDHRLQRDQKSAGRTATGQFEPCDQDSEQSRGYESHATVAGETGKKSESERPNSGRRQSLHRREGRQPGDDREEIQGLVRRSSGRESHRGSSQIEGGTKARHSGQTRENKEGDRMRLSVAPECGVAHASRVLVSASRRNRLSCWPVPGKVRDREDALTNTRDACATQTSRCEPASENRT